MEDYFMKKTDFIITLPKKIQESIKEKLRLKLLELGSEEFFEDAMSGRLCDIEELIDITEYL